MAMRLRNNVVEGSVIGTTIDELDDMRRDLKIA